MFKRDNRVTYEMLATRLDTLERHQRQPRQPQQSGGGKLAAIVATSQLDGRITIADVVVTGLSVTGISASGMAVGSGAFILSGDLELFKVAWGGFTILGGVIGAIRITLDLLPLPFGNGDKPDGNSAKPREKTPPPVDRIITYQGPPLAKPQECDPIIPESQIRLAPSERTITKRRLRWFLLTSVTTGDWTRNTWGPRGIGPREWEDIQGWGRAMGIWKTTDRPALEHFMVQNGLTGTDRTELNEPH